MKFKTRYIVLWIFILIFIFFQLKTQERFIFFPDKGSLYDLTFEKLEGVEYNSIFIYRRIDQDNSEENNPLSPIEVYANSKDEKDREEIKTAFINIKLKEVTRLDFSSGFERKNSYEVGFFGRSEKIVDETTKYIFENRIMITFDTKGDYISIELRNGDDFKEEKYYEITEGNIDFEALNRFIEANKRED